MKNIYQRRSVRNYTPKPVDRTVIHTLLDAAVRAPTAMDQEPWSFVVIQDQSVLDRVSIETKARLHEEVKSSNEPRAQHLLHVADNPQFHVFHNASTLILICGKFAGPFVEADCWLAAENLMLAACASGLGTCVIGFAVAELNTPQWKAELKIPEVMTVIAPIIVGTPAGETPPTPRKPPEILSWK
jgi:nitroreductase